MAEQRIQESGIRSQNKDGTVTSEFWLLDSEFFFHLWKTPRVAADPVAVLDELDIFRL